MRIDIPMPPGLVTRTLNNPFFKEYEKVRKDFSECVQREIGAIIEERARELTIQIVALYEKYKESWEI